MAYTLSELVDRILAASTRGSFARPEIAAILSAYADAIRADERARCQLVTLRVVGPELGQRVAAAIGERDD